MARLGFVLVVFLVILLNLLLLAGRLATTFCTGIANIAGWFAPTIYTKQNGHPNWSGRFAFGLEHKAAR